MGVMMNEVEASPWRSQQARHQSLIKKASVSFENDLMEESSNSQNETIGSNLLLKSPTYSNSLSKKITIEESSDSKTELKKQLEIAKKQK